MSCYEVVTAIDIDDGCCMPHTYAVVYEFGGPSD